MEVNEKWDVIEDVVKADVETVTLLVNCSKGSLPYNPEVGLAEYLFRVLTPVDLLDISEVLEQSGISHTDIAFENRTLYVRGLPVSGVRT